MDQDQAPEDGQRRTGAEVARAAVISGVAENLALLGLMLAVNIMIAKRDAFRRAGQRAVAAVRHDDRRGRIARELAEFRREVSEISAAGGSLT